MVIFNSYVKLPEGIIFIVTPRRIQKTEKKVITDYSSRIFFWFTIFESFFWDRKTHYESPCRQSIKVFGDRSKNVRCVPYPLVICYIAIENGPVEIGSFPIKNGDVP